RWGVHAPARGRAPCTRRSDSLRPRACGSIVRRLVVPDLDQVLAGVEEVDGLSGSARARLVAGSPHVSHGVERVAIWKPRVDDPAEDVVELRPGHREREMVAARGAPRCELERELGGHPDDGERLPAALLPQTQDRRVEVDAGGAIVDAQDDVIELCRHDPSPLIVAPPPPRVCTAGGSNGAGPAPTGNAARMSVRRVLLCSGG